MAFGIAMAFFETAVVVYLRLLYYPEGFKFPLKIMSPSVLSVEYLRELSTIIMITALGYLAGKCFVSRFAYFLICFGVWDIFYYIWLKVVIGWPESLWTWDILFLIPAVWASPVLAPVLCAFSMIFLGAAIIYYQDKGVMAGVRWRDWNLLIAGSIVVIASFMWEYTALIIEEGVFINILGSGINGHLPDSVIGFVPISFNWILFFSGFTLIWVGIGLIIYAYNCKIK